MKLRILKRPFIKIGELYYVSLQCEVPKKAKYFNLEPPSIKNEYENEAVKTIFPIRFWE